MLPGVKEVHAVDAAGVHPLLLAIGSERYMPFMKAAQPQELLHSSVRDFGTRADVAGEVSLNW